MSLPDSRLANAPRVGVPGQKPKFNVYTTLLVIALVALLVGCLCLWGEMSTYGFDFKATSGKA
jgi:hypothetical protein